MGFKVNDISKNLIDAANGKGVLINLKKQHLTSSLAGKNFLYVKRRRFMGDRKLRRKKKSRRFFYVIKRTKYSRKR